MRNVSLGLLLLVATLSNTTLALVIDKEKTLNEIAAAQVVANIEVTARHAEPHPTFYSQNIIRASVAGVEKGPAGLRNSEIEILTPGGERGGIGVFISGAPSLYIGKKYKVHLNLNSEGRYVVAGNDLGVSPLDEERGFSRNRTDGSNGEGDGAFLYWDATQIPIPYFIAVNSFKNAPDFIPAIDAAFNEWTLGGNTRIDFIPLGCTTLNKNENDGVNTILLVSKNWTFDSSAIAITRNFYVASDGPDSGRILDSDILLNAVDHKFTTTDETGKHDVQNIVTHEVGHFIGLGHEISPADSDATMFALASPNQINKRTLSSNDSSGAYAAYPGVTSKYPKPAGPSCSVYESSLTGCLNTRGNAQPSEWMWFIFWGAVLSLGPLIRRILI